MVGFLGTRLGLSIRATGDNEAMVRASSINVDGIKMLALALSNGISTFKVAVALAIGISLVLSVPIPKRHRNKV